MKHWKTYVIGPTLCAIASLLQPPSYAQELTVEELDDRTRVLVDGEPFTEIIHGDAAGFGEVSRPFLYPIYGPTGATMTRNFPMDDTVDGEEHDHPHHRSFWFAHPVNGADFWSEVKGAGRIVPDGKVRTSINDEACSVAFDAKWISADEKEVLRSTQTYRFGVLEDESRTIDVRVELITGEDVEQAKFEDTKEGTMALRSHPALRLAGEHANGQAINSEGHKNRELWGKRAKWVAYWGEIDGEDCGFAIFDHPDNLRHPTWWHARHYGLVAANPFGIHDFEKTREKAGEYILKPGKTLTFEYRFVFYSGTAEEAKIGEKYDAWATDNRENTPR